MESTLQQLIHAWTTGGWVMPALAVLGLIMYGTAAHLLIHLYYGRVVRAPESVMRGWVKDPQSAPSSVHELIRYTQDEVHSLVEIEGRFREIEATQVNDVDRRIAFLNVMVVSAPLFGLLGTVMGMLLTFKAIGIGGGSASEIVSKGISEALVATQTGMMVAIPGLVVASIAKRWRNEFVSFIARLESITLRHFRPEFHGMTRIIKRPARSASKPADPKPTLDARTA